MYVLLWWVFLCMYLRQAVSLQPPLGIEWDLFYRSQPVQEVQFEPTLVTCSFAEPPDPVKPRQSRQARSGRTRPLLQRIALNRHHVPSEMGPGCRNAAHQELTPSSLWVQSSSIFYVHAALMGIFVYVPAAGRIAPTTARNRVGPLLPQSASTGGPVRAHAGHLQLRGASWPCETSAIEASVHKVIMRRNV